MSALNYVSGKIDNPIPGSTYFDSMANMFLSWDDKFGWVQLMPPRKEEYSNIKETYLLEDGRCTCCGANDSGLMSCKYCRNSLRIYVG